MTITRVSADETLDGGGHAIDSVGLVPVAVADVWDWHFRVAVPWSIELMGKFDEAETCRQWPDLRTLSESQLRGFVRTAFRLLRPLDAELGRMYMLANNRAVGQMGLEAFRASRAPYPGEEQINNGRRAAVSTFVSFNAAQMARSVQHLAFDTAQIIWRCEKSPNIKEAVELAASEIVQDLRGRADLGYCERETT